MRFLGVLLGCVGAVAGLALQVKVWIEGWGSLAGAPGSALGAVGVMAAVALVITGLGVAGAVLALRGRRAAGWLMLVSGLAGFPLLPGYTYVGPLLIAGGLLCIFTRRTATRGTRTRGETD